MEITNANFCDELENISKNLKQSCFVGFDAEFTAILSSETFKHRLFDTSEDRYNLMKNEVSNMIMTQVGLTMFLYDRDLDTYKAIGYTFHLCPQVFGDIDQSFIFQASTLRFLCKHNFDFNKFTYNGLPYLSKAEEAMVRQELKDKNLFNNLTRSLVMDEERKLQYYCSEVSKWLASSDEGTMYLDVQDPVLRYIVHNELRLRFDGILTTNSLGNSNKVLIYRDKYVEGASSAPMQILEDNLMTHLLGFSQIIDLLITHRKPLIGHNIYLDTILLHNQFIGPLPYKYSTFKKNINDAFPLIFDTKTISYHMRKLLTVDEAWKTNVLQDLYEFFAEGKCKKLEKGVNLIRLMTSFNVKQSFHEAGWDSYCSGYCFIRLGHWAACELRGHNRPVGPTEILSALAPHANKVNVIRGAVPYMNLAGSDPLKHRPMVLHIKSINDRVINVSKVASSLAAYGSVDVKLYDARAALVATNSQYTADRILGQFKNNTDYKVTRYNPIRHSKAGRMALWSGAILTTGIFVYFLHKNVNK
ncbi:pre-piRNA 3'-exonuclease trimmer-like [Pieris brassicae]|uniref:Pre-piRNA 3'-exonuclease trimmer n=1 Tax=Pieris brassicae TaxID=7116 RepID=A0A9P0TRP6_PIEBR|nr:pre-piRNA 3'-exonuclease trimmer-like [Pieris brassicae]CAH4037251.1 unnamed protein product [Pieris brassicae]